MRALVPCQAVVNATHLWLPEESLTMANIPSRGRL